MSALAKQVHELTSLDEDKHYMYISVESVTNECAGVTCTETTAD